MTRIVHCSDLHFPVPLADLRWRDVANSKRLIGLLNYLVRRRRHFAAAPAKLAAMRQWLAANPPDALVVSGDYAHLGMRPELQAARHLLEPLRAAAPLFLMLPGNHDCYVPEPRNATQFAAAFGDWLASARPELQDETGYPILQLLGDDIAFLLVNSAKPNPLVWRSTGRVPAGQLESLRTLLNDPQVKPRQKFCVLHYNLDQHGHLHDLENREAMIELLGRQERVVVLHGHNHRRQHYRLAGGRLPVFNAGSLTYAGREGFWSFTRDAGGWHYAGAAWSNGAFVLEPPRALA